MCNEISESQSVQRSTLHSFSPTRTHILRSSPHQTTLSPNRTQVVELVAEQSWLITKLVFQLLWALRVSKRWIISVYRLFLFVFFLLPAFLRTIYDMIRNPNLRLNIVYGSERRNYLDVYCVPGAENKPEKLPVLVFLSGGAWIIGYKGWGAILGTILSAIGIIVVTPDHRNFPQGTVPDMVTDVSMALQWVFDTIEEYGGDVGRVTVMGQSAGAHVIMCAMLERLIAEKVDGRVCCSCTGSNLDLNPWKLNQIKHFIGVSGAYNIEECMETFHSHGLHKRVLERIMDGRAEHFSPTLRLHKVLQEGKLKLTSTERDDKVTEEGLVSYFPPCYLIHGTADKTVHYRSSVRFGEVLEYCGVYVNVNLLEGKTHTDPILEDIFIGNDYLRTAIQQIVQEKESERSEPIRLWYPHWLYSAARVVNPF